MSTGQSANKVIPLGSVEEQLASIGGVEASRIEVVITLAEGEIEGKCFPGRQRRPHNVDDVKRWNVGGLPAAPGNIAGHIMID